MFWSREKEESGPSGATSAPRAKPDQQPAETEAIEAVAALLRSLGRHAFDLDGRTSGDIRETFERWALRLLVGETSRDKTDDGAPGIRRDWAGLKRAVDSHRREEREYVVTALENLRQAVREFVRCTTASLRNERENDLTLASHVDELERALASKDHEQIRQIAAETARVARSQILSHRAREHETMLTLKDTIGSLQVELDQARRAASIDALTQVYNRAALDVHLRGVADHAFLAQKPTCLVMVDLDHFKLINDSFGHATGDLVLRNVADAIVRAFLRKEDFVARYGGEEFCVVAEHATFEATRERAERLRRAVEELRLEANGRPVAVSVSFGIASLEQGESPVSWLARADAALYRAKQKGRNRISVAPPAEKIALFDLPAHPLASDSGRLLLDPPKNLRGPAPTKASASEDPGPPASGENGPKTRPKPIAALLKR